MTADDQIREFLASELEDAVGGEIKRESSEWVASYGRWADLIGEQEALSSCVFLAAFARAPGVTKKVERLKDAQGRVRKNHAGTPLRQRFYVLRSTTDAAVPSAQINRSLVQGRDRWPRKREIDAVVPSPSSMRMSPIELEHPINAVIDAVESLVRTVVANGGEVPLRTRLQQLLSSTDSLIAGRKAEMAELNRARDQALGAR